MPYRINLFGKIVMMLIVLLIPLLFLYSLTNRITNGVLQEQIRASNLEQLSFFVHQLDTDIERLSMQPILLSSDPSVREYVDQRENPAFDVLKAQTRVIEKLGLQSVSSGWVNDLTLAIPRGVEILSSNIYVNGTHDWPWDEPIHMNWTYVPPNAAQQSGSFIREVAEPFRAAAARRAQVTYQVRFSNHNLISLLNTYKQDRRSDPFLYSPEHGTILNDTPNAALIELIAGQLSLQGAADHGQETLELAGQHYLISYVQSEQLGWFLLDYVPVEQVMSPIHTIRQLFYASSALLLVFSVFAAFLLYRNIQIPLGRMMRGVLSLKRGDWSTRIEHGSNNEFDYLARRINEMAEQIQRLVEDVYVERIRSREATVKQLQSQIHPHFLYNSLFFIINSAEMEDKESVVAMAQNLAEFYRYTTRLENQSVLLRDELHFIEHYMTIQSLRIHRLAFSISVPPSMLDERIPRLSLQPVVENAIVHGIERSLSGDAVTIMGEQDEEFNRMIIENNGESLTEERLAFLREQLDAPMTEEIGTGTWNVHHRLYYQYGEGSGLTLEHRPGGGVRVILTWARTTGGSLESGGTAGKENAADVTAADSGR